MSYQVNVTKIVQKEIVETKMMSRRIRKLVTVQKPVTERIKVVTEEPVTECRVRSKLVLVREPCRILPSLERSTWTESETRMKRRVDYIDETYLEEYDKWEWVTEQFPVQVRRTVDVCVTVPETRSYLRCWTTWERIQAPSTTQPQPRPSSPSQELPYPKQMPSK